MTLSDDDIRAIVARAEELHRSGDPGTADAEAVVHAGEELGISRAAMQRALLERLGSRPRPATGELVFARSADDRFYAAEVMTQDEHSYRVRFLRGGERSVAVDELRACPFLPGDRVTCPWPGWGTWTGSVLGYDTDAQTLTVSDGWGETATFAVRDVWLAPLSAERQRRRRIYVALIGAGAAMGAVLGALITALVS